MARNARRRVRLESLDRGDTHAPDAASRQGARVPGQGVIPRQPATEWEKFRQIIEAMQTLS